MGHLNERGWINVATLVVYLPLLAGTLLTLYLQRFRMKSFYYLLTFILVKFVGAAMTIDVQLNNNTSLYTPAAILSTVVLTPLVMAVADIINLKHAAPRTNSRPNRGLRPLELVNRSTNTNNTNNAFPTTIPTTVPPAYSPYSSSHTRYPSPTPSSLSLSTNKPLPAAPTPTPPPRSNRLTRLAHLAILLSLGLGVTGGLRVFGTAPSSSDLSSGRTFMRAAAALAALALLLTAVNALAGLGVARALGGSRWWGWVYGGVIFVAAPALAARVAYTVGVAVEGVGEEGEGVSVWDPVRGSWVLYLCLAWVPEVVVGVVLVCLGVVRPRRA